MTVTFTLHWWMVPLIITCFTYGMVINDALRGKVTFYIYLNDWIIGSGLSATFINLVSWVIWALLV